MAREIGWSHKGQRKPKPEPKESHGIVGHYRDGSIVIDWGGESLSLSVEGGDGWFPTIKGNGVQPMRRSFKAGKRGMYCEFAVCGKKHFWWKETGKVTRITV